MRTPKFWLFLGILTAPVTVPLVYAFFAYIVLSLIGFHPDAVGTELAEELARSDGDPRECLQILHPLPHFLSPSGGEQRANCLHEYAQLTLDPKACAFLLPSEYGLDCMGTVASSLAKGFGCSSYESGDIYCSSSVRGKNIGTDDCTKYVERDLQDWCYEERTRTLAGIYECNRVSADPPGLREECQRWYAFKEKDPSLCSTILDEKRRQVCELKINAWLSYPQLRNSFYFGTPVPID